MDEKEREGIGNKSAFKIKVKSEFQCKQEPPDTSHSDTPSSEMITTNVPVKREFPTETEIGPNDNIKKQKVEDESKLEEDAKPEDPEEADPEEAEVLKSGSKVVYSCNTCRKTYDSLTDFNNHSKKHSETDKVTFTKFYGCSLCMYMCKRAASLLKHISGHGKRKYGCETCDYTTNRPSVLKLHMLTHTSEQPLACSECCFRTTQERYLKNHYLRKHDVTFH